MIRIVEQIGNPIWIPAYRDFELGQIVKIVRTPNSMYCSLSDDLRPFGMVIGSKDSLGNIPILYGSSSIVQTSVYEDLNYQVGDLLFCNLFGTITKEKTTSNSIPIAYVEDLITDKYLEIRWI